MTGYVRTDTVNNIADGNVISAADLDGEFNAVQAGFNSSTGHTHDGTSAEGAPITKLGPVQDVTISTTVLGVKTTNTVDLGTSSLKFKDFYLAGAASIGGTLGVTSTATFTGAVIFKVYIGRGKKGCRLEGARESTFPHPFWLLARCPHLSAHSQPRDTCISGVFQKIEGE